MNKKILAFYSLIFSFQANASIPTIDVVNMMETHVSSLIFLMIVIVAITYKRSHKND